MKARLSEKTPVFNKSFIKVFSLCLLFSFVFWGGAKLSKEYTMEVSYEIEYVNLPLKKVFYTAPSSRVFIRQRGKGYAFLKGKLFGGNVLRIDLSDAMRVDGKRIFWRPKKYIQNSTKKIMSQWQIIDIFPDVMWLPLTDLASKTVEVKPDLDLEYKEGFREKTIRIKPDSVQFIGTVRILDSLDRVFTEKWIGRELNKDTLKTLSLILPEGVKSDVFKVGVQLEVEAYTEKIVEVPIEVLNLPEGFQAQIVPERAELIFKVSHDKYEKVSRSDFSLVCDIEWLKEEVTHLPLILKKSPYFLRDIVIKPDRVEVIGLIKLE